MRIIIIDDDTIVLMSLKMIIEASGIDVCATGSNGEDSITLYEKFKPDIILSDIRMEGMTGIDAAKEILKQSPDAKVLFLTTFSDDEYVIDALKCGARGYILKQDYEGIVPALHAVYSGQSVFGGEIINKIPTMDKTCPKFDYESKNITEKEFEIMKLVAEGLNNREIAETMFLSEGTIRNYLSNILDKLQVRDRTQLVVYYYKHLK